MKNLIVIPLLLLMLLKPLWPIVEYIINYDYISNTLCENRDKPQLNCDGKCYLFKQLAKENKQQEDNPFEQRLAVNDYVQWVYFVPKSTINQALRKYQIKQSPVGRLLTCNDAPYFNTPTPPPKKVV